MEVLHLVRAGGSMEKIYPRNPQNHGYNFAYGEPAFLTILARVGYSRAYTYSEACKKDSLDMTDGDRRMVSKHVSEAHSKQVIITHGTDTILETAKTIAALAGSSKTVVLTGAYQPAEFRTTDADFNLGMAVAAVQILPPGVYIALDGIVVPWHEYVRS